MAKVLKMESPHSFQRSGSWKKRARRGPAKVNRHPVNLLTNSSTTSNYYNHTMCAVTSQSLSTALTVISANIEGLTAAKVSILSVMCKRECCHCLCLQETHRSTNLPRPKIAGMSLVVERPHTKYGSAIIIRNDLKVNKIYEIVQGTVEIITIVMPGVVVHCVQDTKRPV